MIFPHGYYSVWQRKTDRTRLVIRGCSLLLSLVFLFSTSACSNPQPEKLDLTTDYQPYAFYSAKELSVTSSDENAASGYAASALLGDRIAVLTSVKSDTDNQTAAGYSLLLYDAAGTLLSTAPLQISPEEGDSVSCMQSDADGHILLVSVRQDSDEDSPADISTVITLNTVDSSGNPVGSAVHFQENFGKNIQNILVDSEGNICVLVLGEVFVYDKSGKALCHMEDKKISGRALRIGTSVFAEKYASRSDGSLQDNYYGLDLSSGKLGRSIDMTGPLASGLELLGCKDGLFAKNEAGIYAYDFAADEMVRILAWSQSDFAFQYDQDAVCLLSKDTILVLSGKKIYLLVRETAKPSEAPKSITIGGVNLDNYPELAKEADSFNKTHKDYQVVLEDYAKDISYAGSGSDLDEKRNKIITQLNLDILSGDGPDILVRSLDLPVDGYESQGIFVDLYTCMEKDKTFKKEDYFTNLLALCEYDGHLYKLGTKFTISGLIGRQSLIGDRTGWTMDEFYSMADSLPEGINPIFAADTQTNVLCNICGANMNALADPTTGKVYFDTKSFIDMLNFAKKYGLNNENPQYSNESFETSRKTSAVMFGYISSLSAYNDDVYYSGEPISVVGYPSDNRNSASVGFPFCLSVLSDSDSVDVSWEFIQSMLTPEAQTAAFQDAQGYDAYIPILRSALEKKIQTALHPTEDDLSNFQFYSQYQTQPLTEETAQSFVELVCHLDTAAGWNMDIMSIVQDETPAFFKDQKTAEETAALIQNRTEILVSEKKS